MIKGIDVSQIQGVIDWNAVAAQGYQFCFIRCYVGNNGKDSMYDTNVAGATAAGLKVGAYNFLFPLPPNSTIPSRSPQAQAQLHYNAVGSVSVVAADLEWPVQGDWSKWSCSATQIDDWVNAYMTAYQTLSGSYPLLYTYPNYMQTLGNPTSFTQYRLWIASYESSPDVPAPWSNWVEWQNSGGTGAGASTLPNGSPVDTDWVQDLSLWNAIPTVAQTPSQAIPDAPSPASEPEPTPPAVASTPDEAPAVPSSNFLSNIWSSVSKLFS